MVALRSQSYGPALRMKQGECDALAVLAPELFPFLLPHLIVPPARDKDPELKRLLTPDEMPQFYGRRVAKYWPSRPCLLDPRFLFSSLNY